MATTLATNYTDARNEISGADVNNMPDARLLSPANTAYLILFQSDSPRVVRQSGSTGGWQLFIGNRQGLAGSSNFSRILNVRMEFDDPNGTTGTPLHVFRSQAEYDMEVATYPGTSGGPRAVYFYRDEATQKWFAFVHPLPDSIYYLSIEGEIEPAALTSGASTLLLSPANVTRHKLLLAHWIGTHLGAPQEVLDGLLGQVGDAKIVAQWLGREESRGEPMKGENRGRP